MKQLRHLSLFAVLLVVALGMSSCGIYGKYKPQTTEEQDSIKVPSYRDIFNDPYLLDLIDTALARNYDLKMAYERVEQAKASLLGAKLAFLPSISASPSVTWSKSVGSMSPGLSYGIGQASWEIDIFGRLLNKKRIAAASKKEMEDYYQATRVELIASVAETYYTLLMLDAQLATAEAAVVTWAQSIETMKAMKEAAMTDEAAVVQFEGSYYSSLALVKTYKLSLVQAENAMTVLLAREIGSVTPRGKLLETAQNLTPINELDLQVVRIRPDVKQAERQLEQAFYGLNLARANCCPSITLSGTLGWNGGLIFSAVGSLLQPIFNSGKNIAEVRSAKHQLQEYQYNYSKALLVAGTEVNYALAARKLYFDKIIDYERQVQTLIKAVDITKTKMDYGTGTYLEVLTAQNDLLSAQLSAISNYMNVLQSGSDLFRALGGGKQ
ncbi:MAG: TolC family protein [Paludibacteraceae bacterium]|nr:TolC family protein [Paludibacteraceae bacterium]